MELAGDGLRRRQLEEVVIASRHFALRDPCAHAEDCGKREKITSSSNCTSAHRWAHCRAHGTQQACALRAPICPSPSHLPCCVTLGSTSGDLFFVREIGWEKGKEKILGKKKHFESKKEGKGERKQSKLPIWNGKEVTASERARFVAGTAGTGTPGTTTVRVLQSRGAVPGCGNT